MSVSLPVKWRQMLLSKLLHRPVMLVDMTTLPFLAPLTFPEGTLRVGHQLIQIFLCPKEMVSHCSVLFKLYYWPGL